MTPTYQWFRDGSPLTGQTSATLLFSPLRVIDSGVYTCEGTKNSTTVRSGEVSVDVAVCGELQWLRSTNKIQMECNLRFSIVCFSSNSDSNIGLQNTIQNSTSVCDPFWENLP
jgi:hypothetical protein